MDQRARYAWPQRFLAMLPACLLLITACSGGKDVPVTVSRIEEPAAIPGAEGLMMDTPRYLIGPGDVFMVKFIGEDKLNTHLRVTPDGYLQIPLVDEPLLVSGMTLEDLRDLVEDKVSRYLVEPQVYLHIQEIGSQHVLVLGNVNHPQLATASPLTLASVISTCGGISKDGQRRQVIVIRRVPGEAPVVFNVDFSQLLAGESLLPDIPLQRYDIVVVPKSREAKVRDWVAAVFQNMLPITRAGIDAVLLIRALREEVDLYYK